MRISVLTSKWDGVPTKRLALRSFFSCDLMPETGHTMPKNPDWTGPTMWTFSSKYLFVKDFSAQKETPQTSKKITHLARAYHNDTSVKKRDLPRHQLQHYMV